jgi:hypothetical protein
MDQILGADGEHTLTARINLAHAHQLLGEVAAAMSELHHVLLVCERTECADHSLLSTAWAMMRQLAQMH